jgi:cytochrome c-type biogenesis protein CcmF
MVANFGFGALIVTLLVSFYGIGAAIYGARKNLPAWVESARLAMLLTFPLVTILRFASSSCWSMGITRLNTYHP